MHRGFRARPHARSMLGVFCATLLLSCVAQAAPRAGTLLDAPLDLPVDPEGGAVQRTFDLPGGNIVVAFVEELGADVLLRIDAQFTEKLRPAAVEVESQMFGTGVELAALRLERPARVTVTVLDSASRTVPGRVHLRVQRFAAAEPRALARAALAWSRATRSDMRSDELQQGGLADMDVARQTFEAAGDPTMAAWTQLVRGRITQAFDVDPRAAWQAARQAERAFLALPTPLPLPAARARLLAAESLLVMSRSATSESPTPKEARAQGEAMLMQLLSPASPLGALERARVTLDLGFLATLRGNLVDARIHAERALAGSRALDDRQGVLNASVDLGTYALEVGDYSTAKRIFDALEPEVMRNRDRRLRFKVLNNGGAAHMRSGEIEIALDYLLRALVLARETGRPAAEARTLSMLGATYWLRGALDQARTHLAQSLELRAGLKDTVSAAPALRMLGAIARESGDFKGALAYHREALARSWRPSGRMRSLGELALDHQALSDHRAAIASARAALAIPLGEYAIGDLTEGAKLVLAQVLLGQPAVPAADVAQALRLLGEALAWLAAHPDITHEITARRLRGAALALNGELVAARFEYERAIELIFDYRGDSVIPELRATALANEQETFRGYVDLLMRHVAARPAGRLARAGADELAALYLLEYARASNFDVGVVRGIDAAERARRDELFATMAQKRVRMVMLLDREQAPTAELDALQDEIAELRAKIDAQHASGAAPSPVSTRPRPFALRDWPPLPARTLQLSYVPGLRHVYLWVRDAAGVRVTRLDTTPARLDAALDALSSIDRRQFPQEFDRQLALLAPLLLPPQVLTADATTIEVSAEGRIAGVPIPAMPAIPNGERSARLFERYAVEMVPSLLRARPAPPRPAASMRLVAVAGGMGLPPQGVLRGHFASLGATEAEVRGIGALFDAPGPNRPGADAKVKLLTGAEGSASAIRGFWERGVDIVHFATHGVTDLRQPLASLLLLPATDPDGRLTYLTAGQVQEWRGTAGLVYLSACESALGPARFADGMPGLQRAFLRAGAEGVIATLWPIEDVLAKEFALEFYRRLEGGASAPRALGETQRAWLSQPNADAARQMTAWAHVFYSR